MWTTARVKGLSDKALRQLMKKNLDDFFVADMLEHLAEKYNAPQGAHLKVKVARCETLDVWMKVTELAVLGKTSELLRYEQRTVQYLEALEGSRNVDSFFLQVAVPDASTGWIRYPDQKEKEELLARGDLWPGGELNDILRSFDVAIFLNSSLAKVPLKAEHQFPLQLVLTHNCLHIFQKRTLKTINKGFDFEHRYCDGPTEEVFCEFLDKIEEERFRRRYLTVSE